MAAHRERGPHEEEAEESLSSPWRKWVYGPATSNHVLFKGMSPPPGRISLRLGSLDIRITDTLNFTSRFPGVSE